MCVDISLGTELDRKVSYVRQPDVSLVTANEQYLGIHVVLRCFPEGGDSIVSVFSSTLLL